MKKNLARILVKYQLCTLIILLLITALLFKGKNNILSVLFGSLIVILSTFLYGCIAFAQGLVVKPKIAIMLHQRAMLFKFILNTMLFMLVIIFFKRCNYIFLFVSYIITQSTVWLILLRK